MTKVIIFSSVFLVLGFIAGLLTGIYMFAVDVDLLGLPYSNSPVVASNDVVVTQGDLKITIPKGATLTYRYSAKDEPYYALDIVGKPFADRPFQKTRK